MRAAHRNPMGVSRALAFLLIGAASLSACGDGGSDGSAGSDGTTKKVQIALDRPNRVVTTRSGTVEVGGTVTPGSQVTLDAGQARVDDGRFTARISGLNIGRSSVVIRAAKSGFSPASVTVQLRRARASRASRRTKRASRRSSAPAIQPDVSPEQTRPAPPPPPRVVPFARDTEAKIRRYLARYYGETAWFRSAVKLSVERRVILKTRLDEGDQASERAADEACFALDRFDLPFPTTVEGRGGKVLARC